MNSFDFLQSLQEIDDELIMKAQSVPKKKRCLRHTSLRIAVIVCGFVLLALTATAVTVGVRILNGGVEVPNYENHYLGDLTVNSKMTTVEYRLGRKNITLPLQWEEALTAAWKNFGYDYEHFSGIHLRDPDGRRIDYGTMAQLEHLLGMELVYSEELETITKGAYVTLSVTDPERAAEQFRTEGMVSPDGLILYLPILCGKQEGLNPEIVDYCGLSIFVPLTDSFVEKYAVRHVISSAYRQELMPSRVISSGGMELEILENVSKDESPLSFYAAWEHEGIGYLMEMKTNRNVHVRPGQILMPYLENLEE